MLPKLHFKHSFACSILAVMLIFPFWLQAATYYSKGSLDPATATNWNTARDGSGTNASAFNVAADVFVIQNTHNMTTTAAWSVGATGSKLQIESGGTLTGNHAVTIATGTTFQIDNGGTYIHNNTGTPSTTIFNGTESFSTLSNYEIRNWINNTTTIPATTFGNLIINVAAISNWNTTGTITTVNGTLDIRATGGGAGEFRLTGRTSTLTANIANISVSGGVLSFANSLSGSGTGTINMTVSGNLVVSGGKLDLGYTGTSTTNLSGDLTVSGTGTIVRSNGTAKIVFKKTGTQYLSSTASGLNTNPVGIDINAGAVLSLNSALIMNFISTTNIYGTLNTNTFNYKPYTLNVGGTLNVGSGNLDQVSGTSITVGGAALGNTGTINCSGNINMYASASASILIQNGGTVNLNSSTINMNSNTASFTVSSGGTLNCGTGSISSINSTTSAFVLNNGATIKIGSPDGITTSGTNGNIRVGGSRTYYAAANYIYDGTVAQFTGNGLTTANNLTFNNAAGVSSLSNSTITVNGLLTVSSGNFTVVSGASLITNGSVNGNVTVEQTIAGGNWHLISAPVSDAVSGMFDGKYLQKHTQSSNTYTDIKIITEPLSPMQGFALFDATGFTAQYTGNLNTGSIGSANNITRSMAGLNSGWNLVGNPYPSSINWDAASGWTKTNINNAVYCHINNATWATYINGSGVNGGTKYIAPGQGFFVNVTDGQTTGTLNMNNSVRVHNNTTFFKDGPSNMVRIQIAGNNYSDEAVVRFVSDATAEFDGEFDAYKLYGDVAEAAQVYTAIGEPLAINSLPETSTVPVGVRIGIKGIYTIAATEIKDLSNVTLEDSKTGIFTDLLKGSYSFSFTPGENEQRFMLHFGPLSINETENSLAGIFSYSNTVSVNLKNNVTGDIHIYNIAGQLVATKLSATGSNEIKLMNTGNYIVKVISKESTVVKKVWIQ